MRLIKYLKSIGPGMILLLVFTAGVAGAGEPFQFGDIEGSEYYADATYDLRDAGITNGCHGGADFCPTLDVSRGQMAAFLDRGLPGITAVTDASTTSVNDSSGTVTLLSIDVEMPGVDGVQYARLSGQVNIAIDTTQAAACSTSTRCDAFLYLTDASGTVLSTGFMRLNADYAGTAVHLETVVPITSQPSSTHTFHLKADTDLVDGTSLYRDKSLSALTIPMAR